MAPRARILFFAESVTASQVVRLVSLARALDPAEYELHFASADFEPRVFDGTPFVRHPVFSLSAETVAARVRSGRRLYGRREIARYVAEDLRVLERVKPDLLVGDFRLSLPVSAAIARVPCASLINAYWSPHAVQGAFPLPEHPIVRLLGEKLAAEHFPKALPWVFSHFAKPVNDVRKAHGLPPLASLSEVLTAGDYCLYADTPGLVPTSDLPPNHEYLGPVLWSPELPLPAERDLRSSELPLVYVTLGSSGSESALPIVLSALDGLPVRALVSTAGRRAPPNLSANVVVAPFVPGDVAARLASVVVSNGGSSTGYQALAEGTPVLGIPENLDQYLAMTAIEKHGSGILLRAGTLTKERVQGALAALIRQPAFRERAAAVRAEFQAFSYAERFRAFIQRVLSTRSPERHAVAGLVVALALSFGLFGAPARAEGVSPSTGEIRFGMSVGSPEGHVLCALFRRAGWLEKPVMWKKMPIRKGEVECVFASIEPGVYALSAIHDENDNGKLDTNFLGIPTESWCTSRDAPAFFGPPSFDNAKFQFKGNVMRLRLSLR